MTLAVMRLPSRHVGRRTVPLLLQLGKPDLDNILFVIEFIIAITIGTAVGTIIGISIGSWITKWEKHNG